MAREYDHLFKLLIIGDSGSYCCLSMSHQIYFFKKIRISNFLCVLFILSTVYPAILICSLIFGKLVLGLASLTAMIEMTSSTNEILILV